MAKSADATDLGSVGKPCRFKSCHPYQGARLMVRAVLLSYRTFTEPEGAICPCGLLFSALCAKIEEQTTSFEFTGEEI